MPNAPTDPISHSPACQPLHCAGPAAGTESPIVILVPHPLEQMADSTIRQGSAHQPSHAQDHSEADYTHNTAGKGSQIIFRVIVSMTLALALVLKLCSSLLLGADGCGNGLVQHLIQVIHLLCSRTWNMHEVRQLLSGHRLTTWKPSAHMSSQA